MALCMSNDKNKGSQEDEIGLNTARVIGRRVAVTAKLLKVFSKFSRVVLKPPIAGFKDQVEPKLELLPPNEIW